MLPNPEELIESLCQQMEGAIPWQAKLVSIHPPAGWIAERIARELTNAPTWGTLDLSFNPGIGDQKGGRVSPKIQSSQLPFPIENSHLILVDDVLYTGRSVYLALHKLFDYGRPASVSLAVLVDRGGRLLPIEAQFIGCRLAVPIDQNIVLQSTANGQLTLKMTPLTH